MTVSWEFDVPVTPILTHARVPLLGTDTRRSNVTKRKKMEDIGGLFYLRHARNWRRFARKNWDRSYKRDERGWSRLSIEPLRDVGTRLVDYH